MANHEVKIQVKAGRHARSYCPVSLQLPKQTWQDSSAATFRLVADDGRPVPLQWEETQDTYTFHWIVDQLPEQQEIIYFLETGHSDSAQLLKQLPGVQLIEGDQKLDIFVQGEFFASYVYDPSIAKPYLGPVMGPHGDSFTRLDFNIKEHPHHRSLWVAIGDVNGVDMWNEPAGVHGKQRHQHFAEQLQGPVFSRFTAQNVWTDFQDRPLIDETRTITVYNTPSDGRIVDLDIIFHAAYGQVEFGATKEAGPLGIRVAESMKVANGGSMVNSYGASGEEECWGQRAHWCDYHGSVGGYVLGIAAFDNPENEHYPTFWHIRNYGLLAANNFYFKGGKLLKKGDAARYKYRVYFHQGNTEEAGVSGQFHNYVNPPQAVRVE